MIITSGLCTFFANIPVREAALHEIQKIMEQPVLCLKNAIHTRWLSHEQSIDVIRRTLSTLIAALEREVADNDNVIAQGLLSNSV